MEPTVKNIIRMEELSKTYVVGEVEVHALRSVNLNINEGEFVAIMGSSGSGKSTLMNLIGCLDTPTIGEYYLDGVNTGTLSKNDYAKIRNQKIGFVFQGFNLLARTTALEKVQDLRQKAQHLLPAGEILSVDITPVFGTHLGPGAVGFVCISA